MNSITIPLTQGKEAIIDVEDLHLIQGFTWSAQIAGKRFYAITNSGGGRKGRRRIQMHSLIANPPVGMEVDHHDGDGLNNRRSNLRIATRTQNAMNRGPASNNRSGFKGVCHLPKSNKWKAQIRVDGKNVNPGLFDTPEDAARAYDRAAYEAAGEFAWLNFPDEVVS